MKSMTAILVFCSLFIVPGVFAKSPGQAPQRKPSSAELTGQTAKSLYFTLVAIKASGGKVLTNENSTKGGYQTSYWTADNSEVQCTESKSAKGTSYSCEVGE